MKRGIWAAAGAVAGILAAGAILWLMVWAGSVVTLAMVVSCAAVGGFTAGWRIADRLEAATWTAQRCWEILGDDRHPLDVQERAAARLARLGRNVVADPVGWWPWRKTVKLAIDLEMEQRRLAAEWLGRRS